MAGLSSEYQLLSQQVEKISSSTVFHSSETLCKLLRFLADHAIRFPGKPVSEYDIATEVLSRRPDFDPRVDSAVRVQTSRLRSRLKEYYESCGAEDRVLLSIPKGAYTLVMEEKPEPHHRAGGPAGAAVPAAVAYPNRRWKVAAAAGMATLLALVILQTVRLKGAGARADSQLIAEDFTPADAVVLRNFWAPLLHSPGGPIVAFSNARFTGNAVTGLRYMQPGDSEAVPTESYTGIGEVMSIHALDRAFAVISEPLRVKRAELVGLDDAQNSDLIFVGSPTENLILREIPLHCTFAFRMPARPTEHDYYSVIENLNPRPGEPTEFRADNHMPPAEDYAVLEISHLARRSVVMLAGITTWGTQAAAEFVTNPDSVQRLLALTPGHSLAAPMSLAVVLRVRVARGVPVSSEIVAVRTGQSQKSI